MTDDNPYIGSIVDIALGLPQEQSNRLRQALQDPRLQDELAVIADNAKNKRPNTIHHVTLDVGSVGSGHGYDLIPWGGAWNEHVTVKIDESIFSSEPSKYNMFLDDKGRPHFASLEEILEHELKHIVHTKDIPLNVLSLVNSNRKNHPYVWEHQAIEEARTIAEMNEGRRARNEPIRDPCDHGYSERLKKRNGRTPCKNYREKGEGRLALWRLFKARARAEEQLERGENPAIGAERVSSSVIVASPSLENEP